MNNYLVNQDVATGGIFKSLALYDGTEVRIFSPTVRNNIITLSDSETIDINYYIRNKSLLSKALFINNSLKNMIPINELTPCNVIFENGDIKRPIVIGFFGIGIKSSGNTIVTTSELPESQPMNNPPAGTPTTVINDEFVFEGHGTITPTYLVLHTIAGPNESAEEIINYLKSNNLGVHGIISNTGVLQTAAWNTLQYHCGGGNSVSIGLEMLESENITWNKETWIPSWINDSETKAYHESVYNHAVNIYAKLAKDFNIPISNVISHKEAHTKIGATNHGDPESLWTSFESAWNDNKWTMNSFRENVEKKMKEL